jgi:hypothetical protein
MVLGNKSGEKLGTLTVSAHARTVLAPSVDRPASRPDHPLNLVFNICPCLLVKVDEPKAYKLSVM